MGIATNSSEPIAGCIHYMPPEFYMNECTQKLDIFMFGLTLNEIYNGVHAEKNYMIKIIKESHIFSDIINQCVSNKPDERPDSNSLKRRLIIIQRLMTFLITEKYSDYIDKNQFEKNEIFINCYNLILKTIRYF
jgi:serine/threonine protein kinase